MVLLLPCCYLQYCLSVLCFLSNVCAFLSVFLWHCFIDSRLMLSAQIFRFSIFLIVFWSCFDSVSDDLMRWLSHWVHRLLINWDHFDLSDLTSMFSDAVIRSFVFYCFELLWNTSFETFNSVWKHFSVLCWAGNPDDFCLGETFGFASNSFLSCCKRLCSCFLSKLHFRESVDESLVCENLLELSTLFK
jgi:hypothetical protein